MVTLLLSLSLGLTPLARAGDCDAKALGKQLVDASPQQSAELFVTLAACDAAAAKKAAPVAVPRLIPEEKGFQAALAAVKVGADPEVRAWLGGLMSDDRGGALGVLGDACQDSPEVQRFLLGSAEAMGDDFWNNRWYRALSSCRNPKVQGLLAAEVEKGPSGNQSRWLGVLEVYARNLGGSAVPKLKELLAATTDDELQTYIINARSDAAGVGAEAGRKPAVATAAAAAIAEAGPQLGIHAVEQARTTLRALGDDEASDAMAAQRFRDLALPSGEFLWGAVVVESATCKNGKTQQRANVAQVFDPGRTWPDEIEGKVNTAATTTWQLDLAARCKGEGTVAVVVPTEPFASEAAFKAWSDEAGKEAQKAAADKRVRLDHDPIRL